MTPKQIQQLRDALRMTQQEFADLLGLQTRGAVSKLESGEREPTGPLRRLLEMIHQKHLQKAGRT